MVAIGHKRDIKPRKINPKLSREKNNSNPGIISKNKLDFSVVISWSKKAIKVIKKANGMLVMKKSRTIFKRPDTDIKNAPSKGRKAIINKSISFLIVLSPAKI